MIKACIFDLDGTLAYTLDSMAVVGNEVVKKIRFETNAYRKLQILLRKRC